MSAFILLWKETEWSYENVRRLAEDCKRDGFATAHWRVRASKKAQKDDTVFVLKQLPEPRGIFARGTLRSSPEIMDDPTSKTGPRPRAEVRFDIVADPKIDGFIVDHEVLKTVLRASLINSRSSGQTPLSETEEVELSRLVSLSSFVTSGAAQPAVALYPDEAKDTVLYLEGAKTTILVNRFERDPNARQACLKHYGYNCSVCDFNFTEKYGVIAANFIHVHHLTQISQVGYEHSVDPINDFRPVCPNCHAVIHRKDPPYSIDQLRELIRSAQTKSLDK